MYLERNFCKKLTAAHPMCVFPVPVLPTKENIVSVLTKFCIFSLKTEIFSWRLEKNSLTWGYLSQKSINNFF